MTIATTAIDVHCVPVSTHEAMCQRDCAETHGGKRHPRPSPSLPSISLRFALVYLCCVGLMTDIRPVRLRHGAKNSGERSLVRVIVCALTLRQGNPRAHLWSELWLALRDARRRRVTIGETRQRGWTGRQSMHGVPGWIAHSPYARLHRQSNPGEGSATLVRRGI